MNKNLHLLPTNKPSKLTKNNLGKFIKLNGLQHQEVNENQNIYITNDEEINKDTKTCWCIDISCNELVLHQGILPSYHYKHYKKIIMTTDKSINVLCSCGKDCGAKESGVQAIPDDFLEWFVNNPSCEQISVEEVYFHGSGYYKASELSEQEKEKYSFMKEYKIIISNIEIWWFDPTVEIKLKQLKNN